MKDHVPSLSEVVDVVDCRLEYADEQGLTVEAAALREAREIILCHIFDREVKHLTWLEQIVQRIRGRVAA
jgi:hypothetical protein